MSSIICLCLCSCVFATFQNHFWTHCVSVLFSEHAHCELTWLHAYGFLFMQGVVFWRGAGKQKVVTQLSDFCLVLSSSTMQQLKHSHQSHSTTHALLLQLRVMGKGGLEPIPAVIRNSIPWTRCQSIVWLTQREKQPFTLTFTPTNLELPISLKQIFGVWKEAGVFRETKKGHGEHANLIQGLLLA